MMPGRKKQATNAEYAFGRTDLLVVILVLSVLALLAVAWTKRSRHLSQTDVCQLNLKHIGMGMAVYSANNSAKVPIAAVHFSDRKFIVWDTLISSYIRSEIARQNPDLPRPTSADVGNMFACPQDTVPRAYWGTFVRKRSYSMTDHTMEPPNWPPSASNQTGLGLWWLWRYHGPHALANFTNVTAIPAVRLEMIQEPQATIAATEMLSGRNIVVGNGAGATVRTTAEQLDLGKLSMTEHHQGKFTYLMVDGHVELLSPEKTVGTGEAGANASKHKGMWTIKAGD